jgi:hypothetical protein
MQRSINIKYDYIIIGSGPSAYASLYALQKENVKLGIITGYEDTKINKNIHDILDRSILKYSIREYFKIDKYELFSPGIIGGLSKFWGGGFFSTKYEDLNIYKNLFENVKDYKSIIQMFDINLNVKCLQVYNNNFYCNYFKKINTYIIDDKKVFEKRINNIVKSKKHFKIYNSYVNTLKKIKNRYFEIYLQNGSKIICKKVILSAGVIGNISILKKSFKISNFTFYDDAPWLVYFVNFNKNFLENYKVTNFIDNKSHINIFSAFYNLRFFKLTELLFFLLRKRIGILNFNFKFPFMRFLLFAQIWTKKTKVKIFIKNNDCAYNYKSNNSGKVLNNFYKFLKNNNIYKIYAKRQKAGYGFHYHNLNLMYKNKNFRINKFLNFKFGKNLICTDTSIILNTSPISVTSSTMAIAYKLTKKLIKN